MKPTITAREVSREQAHAGIHARESALAQGGDPRQVSALMQAAGCQSPTGTETPCIIGGVSLHTMDLATSLASTLLTRHAHVKADDAQQLVVARLAFVFHDPAESYELLSTGQEADLRELDRAALDITGRWQPAEIEAFGAYLVSLRSPAEEAQDDTPGKLKLPPRQKTRRSR